MSRLLRVGVALLPLASVPAVAYVLAMGNFHIGAGEMDLIWVLPWFLWSIVFAGSSFYLWHRGWPFGRALVRSAGVGVAMVLLIAIVLAVFGQLGVAGRF